jgi:hypothetical protein
VRKDALVAVRAKRWSLPWDIVDDGSDAQRALKIDKASMSEPVATEAEEGRSRTKRKWAEPFERSGDGKGMAHIHNTATTDGLSA